MATNNNLPVFKKCRCNKIIIEEEKKGNNEQKWFVHFYFN